jgi:hypothetical protein
MWYQRCLALPVEADMEVSWDLLDEEVTIDLAPFILML